ncbi:alcohol dehydrogenase catalytic domain-containing protein [Alicyclobacillus mengziensis]|uniref:Alcohol dehydrogenase catalytic domain-containing protein n=1 Tax=Alicyclobacillus mengziensis TaxID=2931921 RepID=A0A9X7VXT8_9BACL|nr:alcohol dehydrogenase catalytic domain-containing protein [Alicyclobacillus mengziensis]QSO46575.1 alcohol dehydrogenase catalytic domain-containing protein [Alicyclobacillus mengziensis]
MRAAIFRPESGIAVETVPEPVLKPGEALIEIDACGVCGSDKQVLSGEPAPLGTMVPVILGHEIAGRIIALGDPVDGPPADFHVGDEVLVFPFISCGTCRYCEQGRENLCTQQVLVGYQRPGGYAERTVVPTKVLLPKPKNTSPPAAALLVDAFATPFHALSEHGGIRETDHVIVIGTGGTGLAGLMLAQAMGARAVGAITRRSGASDAAVTAGAKAVWIQSDERRVAREIRRWSEGGADVVLDTVGSGASVEFGLNIVRPGGRLCVIGMGAGSASLPIAKTVRRAVTLTTSFGSTMDDVRHLIALTESGRLHPERLIGAILPLERIAEAFLPNALTGRVVITPGQGQV